MIATTDDEIIFLSLTYPGSIHDKKICDEEQLTFLKQLKVFVDLGFLGLTSEIAQVIIPYKKSKKKKLTTEQEAYNKWVSKIRVQIEHIIASVKIFRKAKEKYRGRLFNREDKIMLIACALHNLKTKLKNNLIKTYSV